LYQRGDFGKKREEMIKQKALQSWESPGGDMPRKGVAA